MNVSQNRALSLTEMEGLSQSEEVLQWQEQRQKSLLNSPEWIESDERLQGRGGGVFIALRNNGEHSAVNMQMENVDAKMNAARIGGKALIGLTVP